MMNSRVQKIIDEYSSSEEAIAREVQLAIGNYTLNNDDLVVHNLFELHPEFRDKLTTSNKIKVIRKDKVYTVTITANE